MGNGVAAVEIRLHYLLWEAMATGKFSFRRHLIGGIGSERTTGRETAFTYLFLHYNFIAGHCTLGRQGLHFIREQLSTWTFYWILPGGVERRYPDQIVDLFVKWHDSIVFQVAMDSGGHS